MMKATIIPLARGLSILFLLGACLMLPAVPVQAQYEEVLGSVDRFSREELAQMLAPIALYPDALLSQILMASTYPIEVVEADRWLRGNSQLQGDALDLALLEQDWDPSVKALCHFPSILALMSERLAETADLGNAFLAQEAEVIAMVQELRAAAYAQGNLTTTAQQNVIVERETIIVEPVNPQIIYVPYYDPSYVYGSWWYPAYPPYYWGPANVHVAGIAYWPGTYFSFSFGRWSYFDWHRRIIYVDAHKRPKYVRHDRWVSKPGPWQHAPSHRRGAAYRDAATAKKYGQPYSRSIESRRDGRGTSERGNLTRQRERRPEDRPWLGQDQRRDERTRLERNRQGSPQPGGQERQVRERPVRERQLPVRIDRDRQERERVQRQEADRERQRQQLVERERLTRESAERQRQVRERAERAQLERSRGDHERQRRQGVERALQVHQGSTQEKQAREHLERVPQPRTRDYNFNRAPTDRKEHVTNERGQTQRQGAGTDVRDRGRASDDGRAGRDNRGGNRR